MLYMDLFTFFSRINSDLNYYKQQIINALKNKIGTRSHEKDLINKLHNDSLNEVRFSTCMLYGLLSQYVPTYAKIYSALCDFGWVGFWEFASEERDTGGKSKLDNVYNIFGASGVLIGAADCLLMGNLILEEEGNWAFWKSLIKIPLTDRYRENISFFRKLLEENWNKNFPNKPIHADRDFDFDNKEKLEFTQIFEDTIKNIYNDFGEYASLMVDGIQFIKPNPLNIDIPQEEKNMIKSDEFIGQLNIIKDIMRDFVVATHLLEEIDFDDIFRKPGNPLMLIYIYILKSVNINPEIKEFMDNYYLKTNYLKELKENISSNEKDSTFQKEIQKKRDLVVETLLNKSPKNIFNIIFTEIENRISNIQKKFKMLVPIFGKGDSITINDLNNYIEEIKDYSYQTRIIFETYNVKQLNKYMKCQDDLLKLRMINPDRRSTLLTVTTFLYNDDEHLPPMKWAWGSVCTVGKNLDVYKKVDQDMINKWQAFLKEIKELQKSIPWLWLIKRIIQIAIASLE